MWPSSPGGGIAVKLIGLLNLFCGRANDVELVVEEMNADRCSVHSNMTTPRLVLPPSEHLQTIVEKNGDLDSPDLQVPTGGPEPEELKLSYTTDVEAENLDLLTGIGSPILVVLIRCQPT